ncbi:hydantoinase/oxoprolinase family protein [Halorussus salinisoli]|uniref:hydantoinase/oxoprolinase family protein n=1 Tax=Halorussus salinisoli TaxID=2558242 RepID=UPI0010C229EC|nr:hydantoinase/oxoprolinase family protein [Halorussus salinisoli]
MKYTLAIDIGGTFTDLYVRDGNGRTGSFKAPTTYGDLTDGVFEACEKAAQAYNVSVSNFLADTDRLIHGTTIATNAIIEDTVASTSLLCTAGFEDVLMFREGGKKDPFDWDVEYPEPYVPRSLTFGVEERIDAQGAVVTPLNEDTVREKIRRIAETDVDAVAVSLLWAHVNPAHEQRIGELLDELAPELEYSLSHEVNPIIREYRRTSSTAIDASLYEVVGDYLTRLKERLTQAGFRGEPLIISANGGVMPVEEIIETPVWTVDSGPTMFPVAARELVQADLGHTDVLALDMGGTSLDMGVIQDGTIPRTREAKVGDNVLGIEKVDVKSIGSGGGSIAYVDEGGLLHVGPESAGSDPGPACYPQGGSDPTVTDAAVVLGYVNENYFLGGDMPISRDAAAAAIDEQIGAKLDLDTAEAAHAVYLTATQNMVNEIKGVTVERGIDPQNYVLSGGGGALGLHAAQFARELRIDDILLPENAGVVSAVGGIISDIRRDFSASHFTTSDQFDFEGINQTLTDLSLQAEEFFSRVGISEDNRLTNYYVEARYPQQSWELQVPLPADRVDSDVQAELVDRFHEKHHETYKYKQLDQEIEFLYWRVEAVGKSETDVATADTSESVETARHEQREAYFDDELRSSPAYRGESLSPGHELNGPALIDTDTTTIVVPPNSTMTVTQLGNYHLSM